MSDLAKIISDLSRRLAELERRGRSHDMEGRVSEIDESRGLFRVDLGGGFVTPWIPARSPASGALKIQAEPTVGEMVAVRSESGDLTDAVIESSGFTSGDRPHGKAGEFFMSRGAASVLMTDSAIVMTVGGAQVIVSADGVQIVGGALTHNEVNVGDTHRHGGVQSGGATTDTPQ